MRIFRARGRTYFGIKSIPETPEEARERKHPALDNKAPFCSAAGFGLEEAALTRRCLPVRANLIGSSSVPRLGSSGSKWVPVRIAGYHDQFEHLLARKQTEPGKTGAARGRPGGRMRAPGQDKAAATGARRRIEAAALSSCSLRVLPDRKTERQKDRNTGSLVWPDGGSENHLVREV